MKQAAKLLLLVFVAVLSCKKSEEPKDMTPHSIALTMTEVNGSEVTIKANGADGVTLVSTVRNSQGAELPLEAALTLNGQLYAGGSFKTAVPGKYIFEANIGELTSNTIVITAVENLDINPQKVVLSVDKPLIKGDNIDLATFIAEVINKDGVVLAEKSSLTLNGNPFAGTQFKSATVGKYVFTARTGNLVSNEITVEVSNDLAGKPYKIILDSDRYLGVIKANNKDIASFKVVVADVEGKVLNKEYELTMNGLSFSDAGFKTDEPGEYQFQASIGSLKSNLYTVTAQEIADSFIQVQSAVIGITAQNEVTATIKFQNVSPKTLKYVSFEVSCYDKAGGIIIEQSKGSTAISCQATGFFEPGSTDTSNFQIGSFPGADHILVTLRSVTLADGTVITAGQ